MFISTLIVFLKNAWVFYWNQQIYVGSIASHVTSISLCFHMSSHNLSSDDKLLDTTERYLGPTDLLIVTKINCSRRGQSGVRRDSLSVLPIQSVHLISFSSGVGIPSHPFFSRTLVRPHCLVMNWIEKSISFPLTPRNLLNKKTQPKMTGNIMAGVQELTTRFLQVEM